MSQVMARDIAGHIRLDPRVKAFLLADGDAEPEGDAESREALLAEASSEEARAGTEGFRQFMERFDAEDARSWRLHAVETFTTVCAKISRDTARDPSPPSAAANCHIAMPNSDRCGRRAGLGGALPLTGFGGAAQPFGYLLGRVEMTCCDIHDELVGVIVSEVEPAPVDAVDGNDGGQRQPLVAIPQGMISSQ
jgi:hypothetical protein